MFFARRQKDPTAGQRLTALLGVALVLALTVLAASPTLHAWLHGETPAALLGNGHPPLEHGGAASHGDKLCAVTLFATGILAAAFLVFVAVPEAKLVERVLEPVTLRVPRSVRYRLPPNCGPPQS